MKLTNLTFETVKQELIQQVKEKYPDQWNDFLESNLGVVFIELMAGITDKLAFYINQLANEMFFATAKQRQGVVKIAKMLGYSPKRAIPSTGLVNFSLSNSISTDVVIPKGTRLKAGNIYVETVEGGIIPAGQTSVNLNAIQRDRVEIVYTAKGQQFERFFIPNEKTYEFLVYVDGILYTETKDFASQIYKNTYKVEEDINGYWIEFYQLPAGSQVRIIAYTTEGSKGNIASNTLKLDDVIKDVQGNIIPVNVSNTVFSGGKDKESIEEIKRNALIYLKTNKRAVRAEDYEGLVLANIPEVAKISAVSPQPGYVDIHIAQFDGNNFVAATQEVKNKVAAYLEEVRTFTDFVSVKDLKFNPVDVSVSAVAKAGYDVNVLKTQIENNIKQYFYNLNPNETVNLSTLYDITNIKGIEKRTIMKPTSDVVVADKTYLNTLGVLTVAVI